MSSVKRNGGRHTTAYTYETASDGGQTGRVKTVKNGSHSENYTYDIWGNVTKVTENSSQTGKAYAYDAQGQLIREYDPDKKVWLGYKYDAGGNLTEVRSYPAAEGGSPEGEGTVIKKFAYGTAWKDQLTAMTMDGTTRNFTYDANGNLLSDGKYTYSWTKGSLLAKVTGDSLEATYTYDASGIRTSKTVNGVKTEYLTAGGSILAEKKNGKWQQYLYDGSGQLMAIRYKGADYYYIRDGLMCITGLVDANGGAVVNYRYDSWGKLISITGSMAGTLGKDNPYRFKGYYYDEETGMYYLKSRYYQPEICRFISADERISGIGGIMRGYNMYSYCFNNPINMIDPSGNWPAFIKNIINAVKNTATNIVNGVKHTVQQARKFVSKYVGTAINVGKEKTTSRQYGVVATYEKGIGYNKNFSTGKAVNAYTNVPENPLEVWEYGSGLDININNYGLSIQKGAENAFAFHLKNISVEVGANSLGRVYGKYTYSIGDGYGYTKLSINFPEIMAVAVLAAYAPEMLAAAGTVGVTIPIFN